MTPPHDTYSRPAKKSRIRRLRTMIILGMVFLTMVAAGCGSGNRRSNNYPRSGKSYVIKGQRYHIMASADGYAESGNASWYGPDFHGKKTASGERYNMHKLTAAHKTLPLQTWVKVTNLDNNRITILRVNDRGPFVRGRIIDVSLSGAKELGMVKNGTARVMVEALGQAETRTVAGKVERVLVRPQNYRQGQFTVQVGAFRDETNARQLADRLRPKYGTATVQGYDRSDGTYYRVQVADVRTLGLASEVQTALEREGFRDCFVVAR